jgi:hypothetical protein
MIDERPLYEAEDDTEDDPEETPIRDRRLVTQPYDLVIESLVDQIKSRVIHLRPLSERPKFQRRYITFGALLRAFQRGTHAMLRLAV